MYVCRDRFSTPFTALALLVSFLTIQPTISKTEVAPVVTGGKVTVTAPQQLAQYTGPLAEGFLDRLTFANRQNGGNGTGTTFVPFSISGRTVPDDICNSIALQPDGCIVMAGYTAAPNGSYYFAVARYLPYGMPDPTFGQVNTDRKGTAYVDFSIVAGGVNEQATGVAVQSDGKIVVGGYSENGANQRRFAVARFTSSGILDVGFGQTGTERAGTAYVNFAITGDGSDFAQSVALQPDGKIVLAGAGGSGIWGGSFRFAVARFTSSGILDVGFGQTGTERAGTAYVNFAITPGATFDEATTLALQPDGKIVLGGTSSVGGANPRLAVARFTSAGILDTSFNQTGTAFVNFFTAADRATGVAVQPDGKIVLGGTIIPAGDKRFGLARFLPTGILDTTTFGNVGTSTAGATYIPFSIAGGTNDTVYDLVLQSDGKIVLGGKSQNGGDFFGLARFTPVGSLDTATFGNVGRSTAGTTYIPFSISGQTQSDQANAMALQPNGRIILAGSSNNNNNPPFYFAMARFVNSQLDS